MYIRINYSIYTHTAYGRYNIASGAKKDVRSCPQAATFGGHDPCASDQRSEGYRTSKQPGQRQFSNIWIQPR